MTRGFDDRCTCPDPQASALILPNAEHYSEDGASGLTPASGDGGVLLAADALRCVCEGAGCVLAAVCELVALLHASYALPLCLAEGPYRDGFQALQHHTDVSGACVLTMCISVAAAGGGLAPAWLPTHAGPCQTHAHLPFHP